MGQWNDAKNRLYKKTIYKEQAKQDKQFFASAVKQRMPGIILLIISSGIIHSHLPEIIKVFGGGLLGLVGIWICLLGFKNAMDILQ